MFIRVLEQNVGDVVPSEPEVDFKAAGEILNLLIVLFLDVLFV